MRVVASKTVKILTLIVFASLVLTSCKSVSPTVPQSVTEQRLVQIVRQTNNLSADVLRYGLAAYYCAHAKGIDHKGILTIIDYSLPSYKKRLWVIDVPKNEVLISSYVTHGRGSGETYASKFSNTDESLQTSLGLMITEPEGYEGRHGHSIRLEGLEPGINDKVYERAIVIHGAIYAEPEYIKEHGRAGRSWGCPAVPEYLIDRIVDLVKGRTLVFSYYPDKDWLRHSKFLHCQGS